MRQRQPTNSKAFESSSEPHENPGEPEDTGSRNSRNNSPRPGGRQDTDYTPGGMPAGQQRGLPPLPRTQQQGSAAAFVPERNRRTNKKKPTLPERLRNVNIEPSQSVSQPSQHQSRKNSFKPNEANTSNTHVEAHEDYPSSHFQPYSSDEQNHADSQKREFLSSLEYPAWQAYEKGEPYDCVERARKQQESSVPQRPSGLRQIPGHGIGQVASHDAGSETRQVSGQRVEEVLTNNSGDSAGHEDDRASDHNMDDAELPLGNIGLQDSNGVLTRTTTQVQGQTSVQILRRSSAHTIGHSWGPVPGHGIGQVPAHHSTSEIVGHGGRHVPRRGMGAPNADETSYPRHRFNPPQEAHHVQSYQPQHVRKYPPPMDDQQHFHGPRSQHGHPYKRGHQHQPYRMHHHFPQQYWRPMFVAPFNRGTVQQNRPQNRRAFQFDCSTPAFVPQFPGNRQLELDILAQTSGLPWVWWPDAMNTEKYLRKHKDGEGRVFLRLKDTPPEKRRTSLDEIDIWVYVGTVPTSVGRRQNKE